MRDEIDFVEAHDARISLIALSPDGRCTIAFSHVAVYYPTARKPGEDEGFEIWSHPARLVLDGASSVYCKGLLRDDRVMDGEIFDAEGSKLRWKVLRERCPVEKLELHLATGTEVVIHCKAAKLSLGEHAEYLERWSGPL
jgi:hypothetical protein